MQEVSDIELNNQEKTKLKMNIGLSETDRAEISEGLSRILSDSYALMIMTHNYHWNVKGKNFRQLHLLTEEQYEEIFDAIDEIAERIRSLGFLAPGSMKEFSELSDIKEPNSKAPENEMIVDLLQAHEHIAKHSRKVVGLADEKSDEATADLLTERVEVHEKTAWMLRSMLEG
ncbi:MAG: DNA starvation/stationary phase protection protein [Vicingaceae bacterium]